MKGFIKIPKKIRYKLKKEKDKIEEFTNTKIKINDEITIEGKSFDVYQTKRVLKAVGCSFKIDDALFLLEDEYGLEIIDLSEYTKSAKRLKTLKGRIIGTKGKTKKYIEKLLFVKLSISGEKVSIMGKWEKIKLAKEAIMKIVEGCRHKTLYRWLEQKTVGLEKW